MPTGTATFGASSTTGITFVQGSKASVGGIEFAAGAAAYTLTFTDTSPAVPTLSITGAGVSNASSNAQLLQVAAASASRDNPQLAFRNSASAGGGNVQYQAGPADASAAGGGVIRFYDTSSAGSASFTVTTGSGTPPSRNSTVGGEVTFSETASAGTASFTVYGSTSLTDGDTFGNVVFHDSATAAQATFTNKGGTVAKGDGGNTQFYDTASAGKGVFQNFGATAASANGGDVAFDGTASAAHGQFHNYASTASGGYGGVTSFNNNCPFTASSTQGSSAGNGIFHNYGAAAAGQYGGHVYFTAKYGSPTAANGTFINHGAAVPGTSANAGRTVFSISVPQPQLAYTPNAGSATLVNMAGTAAGAPGGATQFTVLPYPTSLCSDAKGVTKRKAAAVNSVGPSAASATIVSLGANTPNANGGLTSFGGLNGVVTSAGNAMLIAMGGTNGGKGGTIVFYADSSGGSATVGLSGNGTLDVSQAGQTLTIGAMNLSGGVIVCVLGTITTDVIVTEKLNIWAPVAFNFTAGANFKTGTAYTVLTAPNLSSLSTSQFSGNSIGQAAPAFSIAGNSLQVTFNSNTPEGKEQRPPRSRTRPR
ncbi:MAG: hypothetical protein K2Y23_19965 [Cyanobacteria bacterium]|nr:hypothetical protein [Cyanobacteriota bacterium]